ncbi:MAG: hypothetical protein LW832_05375, partial [Parachlamydia sp.]|nr:hypothetical protein [Parachlamydia sp.]
RTVIPDGKLFGLVGYVFKTCWQEWPWLKIVGNDKDESLKEIFNMYLKLKNFDVEEASDGEEGLKKRKLGSPISFY